MGSVHDDDVRKVINASVCQSSQETLKELCAYHGVTLCALIDAIGHMLAESVTMPPAQLQQVDPRLLAALEEARQIDVGRRTRD